MKKALVLFLSFCLLALCGCNSQKSFEIPEEFLEKADAYESLALLAYGELKANVAVTKEGDACSVTFQSPEALQGMRVLLRNGKVSVSLGSLTLQLGEGSGLEQHAVNLVFKALNSLSAETGLVAEQTENGLKLSGEMEEGRFSLLLDGQTGCLMTLDMPEKDLHLEFYEFRFTKSGESKA